jgi:hypothetical protein
MGRNTKTRKRFPKSSCQPGQTLIGLSARNELRQFVKETSTAKLYAIGFCLLSAGITFVGFVTSLFLGSQKSFGLGNLVLAGGGYSVLCKLKRWVIGRRLLRIK